MRIKRKGSLSESGQDQLVGIMLGRSSLLTSPFRIVLDRSFEHSGTDEVT